MSYPVVLNALTAREAITDAVYRSVNAIDIGDRALYDSAFTKDATFEIDSPAFTSKESVGDTFGRVANLDTTHLVTNVRVQLESESKASVTATAVAYHYRPGEGAPGAVPFVAGGQYHIASVRDEQAGVWRIQSWKLKATWMSGDPSIVA